MKALFTLALLSLMSLSAYSAEVGGICVTEDLDGETAGRYSGGAMFGVGLMDEEGREINTVLLAFTEGDSEEEKIVLSEEATATGDLSNLVVAGASGAQTVTFNFPKLVLVEENEDKPVRANIVLTDADTGTTITIPMLCQMSVDGMVAQEAE